MWQEHTTSIWYVPATLHVLDRLHFLHTRLSSHYTASIRGCPDQLNSEQIERQEMFTRQRARLTHDRESQRYRPRRQAVASISMLTLSSILLLMLFASCGTTTGPSAYVWTDRDTLNTLTWNDQNGSLSGQYTSVSYAHTSFPAETQPDMFGAAYTGALSNGMVSIIIGSEPRSENVTGAQSSGGATLALAFPDPSTGETLHQTWVAITASQQAQLFAAFTAYQQVQGWLGVVSRDTQQRVWTDPNTFYLDQVWQSVSGQQAELTAIKAAQNEPARCQLVARFQPIASSAFTLPITSAQDGTLHDYAMLAQAWNRAQRVTVPQIAGLALLWVIAPPVYRHATTRITALAARLQSAYRQDAATMRNLQHQDQQIAQQVTVLGKGCPPMPA